MIRKIYEDNSDTQSEDSSNDSEYLQKLERLRKMESVKKAAKTSRPRDEEDEEPNILKPKLKQPVEDAKPTTSNNMRSSHIFQQTKSGSLIRPTTSYSTIKVPTPKPRKPAANDPVSRYQQMNSAWRKDNFLLSGANKKEGRKLLHLTERSRKLI